MSRKVESLMGKKLPGLFFASDGRGGATAIHVLEAFREDGSGRVVVKTAAGNTRYAQEHERPLRLTPKQAMSDNKVTA